MDNSDYLKDRIIELEAENAQLRKENNLLGTYLLKDEAGTLLPTKTFNPSLRHWLYSLSVMLDNLNVMIGYWDKYLLNRYSNHAYSVWFGVSPENLYGKPIKALLGDHLYALNQPHIQAVLQGVPQQFERAIPSADGANVRHSLIEYIPDMINGQVEGFFVHVSDVTSIKLSEVALQKSEERYRTVVQDQTELISRLHGDGRYIFANEAFLTFFGKTESALIGNNWVPLVYKEDIERVNDELSKLSPENTVVMIENRVHSASGEVHWMQFSHRGTFDPSGQLIEIQSVGRDITQQKNAERNLRLASVVFNNSIEGILVTDANGVIISVNPAFTVITGFNVNEVLGNTPRMFMSGHHDQVFYNQLRDSINKDGFWQGEIWKQLKNGEVHPLQVSITSVKDSNGETLNYVGIFSDNTENKKLEEQRLLDEAQYRNALVREVHHRIKNNLQGVVLLMGSMAAKYPELTDPIGSAITQVSSIALVHGIQGNSDNSAVTIIHLVKAIVDTNQTLYNACIALHTTDAISSIYLIEKEAVPTALILNELLTNAIKHSEDLNSICIEIQYDASQQTMTMQIKNQGSLSKDGSSLDQPEFGTGLKLVKSLMPHKSMKLSWKQENDWVITTVALSYPIITAEP
jgi:PAS domain S-box-containing protein